MRMGISIDKKLGERLNQMHIETRIDKSKLLDEAIEYLFQMNDIEIDRYEYRFKIKK